MIDLRDYFLNRFLYFTGSITFKWYNGVATILMVQSVIMGVSGELIAFWYSANVLTVKDSLLFLKYNTLFGDILIRTHKLTVNVAFAVVFFHMFKGLSTWAGAGSRVAIWKSGMGILICMFGASYAGCILPWNVLSPTLYTMIQTIVDTYVGGWAVFILLGGERLHNLVLERTLIAHILFCLVGLGFVVAHVRFIHFNNSSINKYYTWSKAERPMWMPNELVKELYIMYFYFFFFLFLVYRKAMTFGSVYITLFKFYYGGATNWNLLPPSIEPEWYFWIFYFALASANSLTGGLFRAIAIFVALIFVFSLKEVASNNYVFSVDSEVWNSVFYFFFIVLSLIFFTRAKFQPWHTDVLDTVIFSLFFFEFLVYPINIPLMDAYAKKNFK